MLRFKEIKDFAETLYSNPHRLGEPIVFPPPHETLRKSDPITELFYPGEGCISLSRYLRDIHDYLLHPQILEDHTFSWLLDAVNGPKKYPTPGNKPEHLSSDKYIDGGFINPLWVKDLLHQESRSIMVSKNHDYRGGSNDPYANFRGSREFDIHPIVGIMLRCQDKFKRIKTFVERGTLAVRDESVKDAVLDVHNYMDLVYGLILEAQEAEGKDDS